MSAEQQPPKLDTALDVPTLSLTSPTPTPSPVVPAVPANGNGLETPRTKGKRKADEVDGNTPPGGNTPPEAKKDREQRATFAISPRPLRASNATTVTSTHAPSSYHRQKRARLSTPTDSRPGSRSGPGSDPSQQQNDTAANMGSWSSRKSMQRPPSRGQSLSRVQSTSQHSRVGGASLHRTPSRRSISQASIPISALISPHAPSIARSGHGTGYHMRDPHKPPRIQPTPWSLSFGELDLHASTAAEDRWRHWTESGGSPLHAWLFFLGFVIFPIWWAAAFLRVLRTRRFGHGHGEKEAQVVLDDPQLEFDARTWRTRCRIMAAVSFVTYVPFIILVAVFARR